jgi:hypothetical protein
VKENRQRGAKFRAGSPPYPKVWEIMCMGERQGWARGEGRWCGELVILVLCVNVCRLVRRGAGSWQGRTGDESDRAGSERMKAERARP